MYFQTHEGERETGFAGTWEEIGRVNRDLRAVRELLREGDVTELARTEDNAIVALIQAPRALVLVTIGLTTCDAPGDVRCLTEGLFHWRLIDQLVRVRFPLPSGASVVEAFEVRDEVLLPLWPAARSESGEVAVDVFLANDLSARLFVFAEDTALRGEIEALLTP